MIHQIGTPLARVGRDISRLEEVSASEESSIFLELQETLAGREVTTPKPKEQVTKVYGNLSSIQEKTEELKSQIVQGMKGLPRLDPGVYKLIDVESLDDGTLYTFKQVTVFENSDQQDIRIMKLFPAVVHPLECLKRLQEIFSEEWDVLTRLGYKVDFLHRTLTLPDCNLLNANCVRLKMEYPSLDTFKAISSEGIATDITFIHTILGGGTVLSNGIEFTHDQIIHIIPELLMRI